METLREASPADAANAFVPVLKRERRAVVPRAPSLSAEPAIKRDRDAIVAAVVGHYFVLQPRRKEHELSGLELEVPCAVVIRNL